MISKLKSLNKIMVVIPSLNPDEKLPNLIKALLEKGFYGVIVVNDGSDENSIEIFEKISKLPRCTVLHHPNNLGKGAALKTAFCHLLENCPDCIGVVTADGDGQHHPDDIVKTAEKLSPDKREIILGVRNLSAADIPFRSRFGNMVSAAVFSLFCKSFITDTQTGLRAIPRCCLSDIAKISGERFEYETNMLLSLPKLKISAAQVKIQTIYLDQNASSHFRPVIDSVKIIKSMLLFGVSSLLCCGIDLLVFWLMTQRLAFLPLGNMLLFATAFARIISSIINFALNRKAVFNSAASVSRSAARYYCLCAIQLLASWASIWALCALFKTNSVIAKIAVDTILFFLSYFIQRGWVFADEK